MPTRPLASFLIVTAGSLRCALPVSSVIETMRPLPLHGFNGAPPFVLGASVIRGEAVPVVDLARLLGGTTTCARRFVVIRVDEHRAALSVDEVIGIEHIEADRTAGVPALLSSVAADSVAALGSLDNDLLAVLRTSRVLPDNVWTALANRDNG